MVETLVAFVVLTIILVMIYKVVFFCSSMRMKSHDTDTVIEKFNQEIYKTDDARDASEVQKNSLTFDSSKGPVFYLMLDTESTQMDKNVKDTQGTDYTAFKLPLYQIVADEYKSVNSMIDSQKLITPKVLRFIKK